MQWDLMLDILGSPVVGNLFLLAAAITGVLGSYLLYLYKRDSRRETVRRALKTELGAMTPIEQWDGNQIPYQKIGSLIAYEANAEDIGLLTDEEVEMITDFYTQLDIMQSMIDSHFDTNITVSLQPNAVDRGKGHRESVIISRFNFLFVTRWKAIQILKKNLGEEYENPDLMTFSLEEGDRLSKEHPLIQKLGESMEERGFIESVDEDTIRVTKRGEEDLLADIEK